LRGIAADPRNAFSLGPIFSAHAYAYKIYTLFEHASVEFSNIPRILAMSGRRRPAGKPSRNYRQEFRRPRLASLFRLLVILAVLAGLGYIGMLALVAFVEPQPHEIVQPLPPSRLNK
jgi:hypothetical protein